jgi:hypothetical protein
MFGVLDQCRACDFKPDEQECYSNCVRSQEGLGLIAGECVDCYYDWWACLAFPCLLNGTDCRVDPPSIECQNCCDDRCLTHFRDCTGLDVSCF